MNKPHYIIFLFVYFSLILGAEGRNYVDGNVQSAGSKNKNAGYRTGCIRARSETDLAINNVRARLRVGGDMWWDGTNAKYIVPNVDPASGEPEVSALFAGGIWLGAYDASGNLFLAAQTYGDKGNDYWAGPLDPATGGTTATECNRWDEHFTVYGSEIDALRADYLDPTSPGIDNTPAINLLGWPGRGNPHFVSIYGFDIRNYNQDLAPFIDANMDGIYNPYDGDHPIIEVAGCESNNYLKTVYADQITWWVYNDNGNIHTQTANSQAMQMEVQVTSFAYSTTDAINNQTFYRYKLLNRNALTLKDTYFSLWSDPDLGCYADDYIGCDTVTGMGYVYNADANDDNPCGANGVAGYGTEIPALGVDYFRGPLDSAGNEIGLSSFQYYVGDGAIPGMSDPQTMIQHYRLMSGYWTDGTPVTAGGNGYDPNNTAAVPTNYVFPSFPNDNSAGAWSMCNENLTGLDQRFLHTSGPFVLLPGATNEMISGVVWVPDVPDYPCPSLRSLVNADELAQNLFDNCFKITNGPDAPFMDIIEMDQSLVLNLSYIAGQNNADFGYSETPAELQPFAPLDTTYDFQGLKIYQVNGPNVSVTELEDETKARLIFQTDIEDDVASIANWEKFTDMNVQIETAIPVIKVEGNNQGLQTTFKVVEDQFAQGEKDLVNHQPYYFCVVAYAHNEYEKYDVATNQGQATPYLQGRRNFRIYTGIPRINAPEYGGINLNAAYGDQPEITRLDGEGVGNGAFLDLADETAIETKVLAGEHVEHITYKPGKGPVTVKVVDPLRIPNSTFRVHVCDQNYQWNKDATTGAILPQPVAQSQLSDSLYWVVVDVNDPTSIWSSLQPMDWNGEQYIPDLGLSFTLEQKAAPSLEGNVGHIGAEIVYGDATYGEWYEGLEDGEGIYNMLKTKATEADHVFDPEALYSENKGGWYPFMLCDAEYRNDPFEYGLSLGNIGSHGARFRNDGLKEDGVDPRPFDAAVASSSIRDEMLSALNNVNIVLTPNQAEWSRCIVVETANKYHGSTHLGDGIANWDVPSERDQMEWKGSTGGGKPAYPSRNKDMSIDPTSNGMSWFPGYAYDVETGERLNIFFGENSLYNGEVLKASDVDGAHTGNDMIFNPTSTRMAIGFSTDEKVQFLNSVMGGQHIIYVTNMPYDSCKSVLASMNSVPAVFSSDNNLYRNLNITWASMSVPTRMLGEHGQLPPTKATVKLRVDRPYEIEEGDNQNLGYPVYEFTTSGLAPTKQVQETAKTALDLMRVVPNPYYAYSDYEVTELDNVVKITNIPAKCNIRIYSLDGHLVREYNVGQLYTDAGRNGIARMGQFGNAGIDDQITTSVDWDVKNNSGVPVAAGVYLIHVKVDGVGTKVLKSFIINRAFDSQRL